MRKKILPKLTFNPTQTFSEQIFAFLKRQIIIGRVEPKAAVSENDLSVHFNVSRHPVREALAKLSAIGLIDIIPKKGTFVSQISVNNLFEVCFVRCAIESRAVLVGTRLADKEFDRIVAKLKKNLSLQEKFIELPKGRDKYLSLDESFHQTICEFSKTTLAWQVVDSIKANVDRVRYLSIGRQSPVECLVKSHQRLMKAIESKAVTDATEILEEHTYEITKTYHAIIYDNQSWFKLD